MGRPRGADEQLRQPAGDLAARLPVPERATPRIRMPSHSPGPGSSGQPRGQALRPRGRARPRNRTAVIPMIRGRLVGSSVTVLSPGPVFSRTQRPAEAILRPNPPEPVMRRAWVGVRGGRVRCAAPGPPCRGRPRSGSADTARSCPKQQRQHQANRPGDHQDDPDGVDAEARGAHVHRKGQDRPHHQQKDADAKAQVPRSSSMPGLVVPHSLWSGVPSKTLGPWLPLRCSQSLSKTRTGANWW
jgi:hypothetical protein